MNPKIWDPKSQEVITKMKFGKSLLRVVDLSDPEWSPYWINYKYLKKKINEIVEEMDKLPGKRTIIVNNNNNLMISDPEELRKSSLEIEFFKLIKNEIKKASEFFASSEEIYRIRHKRVKEAYQLVVENNDDKKYDKNTWTRLLMACVQFYKDVLFLENFAIMNYCAVSKILKKHDKLTGFATREAFLRNVMPLQNFTTYPFVLNLIKEAEKLFSDIQSLESVMPLKDEEKLFIEAIRDLNYRASLLQAEENDSLSSPTASVIYSGSEDSDCGDNAINSINNKKVIISSSCLPALDAAAEAAVLAAINANHNSTSPSIQNAILWMQDTKNTNNTDNNNNDNIRKKPLENNDDLENSLKKSRVL
jgi:SPX domain protein involved in polyphosphate accumulation